MRPSGWMLVVLLALTSAACHKAQARVPEPPPALAVPTPPPRTPIPVSIEPPPVVEAPPVPEPTTATAKTPVRNPSTTQTPPPPPTTTPPPTAPEAPPPVLQPSNVGDLEKSARALVNDAQKNLAGVMLNNLSEGGRSQYFSALRFVRMAQQALEAKNFLYANQLASNAATLARLLIKK